MSGESPLYRVMFYQEDDLYEIYARSVSEEGLMGFVVLEELVLSDPNHTIVVDPSEERLQNEFKGVKRCYVPVHNVIRIDEVQEPGIARIKDNHKNSNVSAFPGTARQVGFDPTPSSES